MKPSASVRAFPGPVDRMIEGAKRYAAGDKSDPFVFARAMTHIGNSVAGYVERGRDVSEAWYDADQGTETRKLPDGREYEAVVWRNLRRP